MTKYGWSIQKEKYTAHFVLKVTDSDAENAETGVVLDFSKDCLYITLEKHQALISRNEEIADG